MAEKLEPPLEYWINSLQESRSLARKLANSLADSINLLFNKRQQNNQAICVFLDGHLGAGKSEWCRQIIGHLGYTGQVTSPTYGLIETYNLKSSSSIEEKLVIHHIDAYRLQNAQELSQIGIEDYAQEAQLLLVEWGQERGCSSVLQPDIAVTINPDLGDSSSQTACVDNNSQVSEERHITIQANTVRGRLLLESLKS